MTGVDFDSRSVEPGHVFVAVPGAEIDGHEFAADAVGRGAMAVIAERAMPRLGVPQLLVGSSRSALALAAAWSNGFPSHQLGVIGITGTDGKTTTSYLVRSMLAAADIRAGMITTVDVFVGGQSYGESGHTTPEAPEIQHDLRRMVDAGDQWAVLESTSHGLALERVAEVAYDVAVLTNITHEHLDLHGTYDAYVAAKRSLFERLAPGPTNPDKGWPKMAVINADDERETEFSVAAKRAGARVLTYAVGPDAQADITASTSRDDGTGLRLQVKTPRWSDELALNLVGHFNAYNALAAVGVGEAMGLDPQAIKRGLEALESVPGRLHPGRRGPGIHRLRRLRPHAGRAGRCARLAGAARRRTRGRADLCVRIARRARHAEAADDGPCRGGAIARRSARR